MTKQTRNTNVPGRAGKSKVQRQRRKKATDTTGQAELEGENRFRSLIEQAPLAINISRGGINMYGNQKLLEMFRFRSVDEIVGRPTSDYFAPEYQEESQRRSQRRSVGLSAPSHFESVARRADGTEFPVEIYVESVHLADGPANMAFVIDITQRRQAEGTVFKQSRVIESFFSHTLAMVAILDKDFNFIRVNEAYAKSDGRDVSEFPGHNHFEFYPSDAKEIFEQVIRERKPFQTFARPFVYAEHPERGVTYWDWSLVPILDDSDNVELLIFTLYDVTQRKRAEEALRASEEKFRSLVETTNDWVWEVDANARYTYVSPHVHRLLGYEPEEVLGRSPFELMPEDEAQRVSSIFASIFAKREPFSGLENINGHRDGHLVILETSGVPIFDQEGKLRGYRGIDRDITNRKRAEEDLRRREKELESIIENSPDAITRFDKQGRYQVINSKRASYFGLPREAIIGKNWRELLGPEEEEEAKIADDVSAKVMQEGIDVTVEYETATPFGKRWVQSHSVPERDENGLIVSELVITRDITERKQAEEMIRRQLARLYALRAIDTAISSSFNLKISLTTVIKHLMEQLGVDAGAVLLFHSNLNMLEYGAVQGFRTTGLERTLVRPSEGYAERVILERQLIQVADLRNKPHKKEYTKFLTDESFVWYCGAPLIAKGKIRGVLEVWNRSPVVPDPEWLDFLNTLAGQAAIAIESTTLFENLQRSNLDLRVAYDETIEGWSRALDLRDKETEGHTQRVTEMTLELARSFGLDESELIYVRWGGLLHDIGKMGVPDAILLKPGALTDEEWVLMKRHPQLAYEMLSPINYLKAAMDIPYCHHEKWDGTGYPRAIKGEHIPLAARIFAVVDVWDALTSDRPYRKGWSKNEALAYIREQSAIHFDPAAVTAFLKLIETRNI